MQVRDLVPRKSVEFLSLPTHEVRLDDRKSWFRHVGFRRACASIGLLYWQSFDSSPPVRMVSCLTVVRIFITCGVDKPTSDGK
jgi:hypothetical protein